MYVLYEAACTPGTEEAGDPWSGALIVWSRDLLLSLLLSNRKLKLTLRVTNRPPSAPLGMGFNTASLNRKPTPFACKLYIVDIVVK